jgi:hypothetical protein
MAESDHMTANNRRSRIAGLLYLGVVLTGIFSLMYVPSKLIDTENAATTFQQISSSETLFRLGIVSGLLCYSIFLFLPLVLYRLFKPVNESMAQSMVILAIISVPMYFINAQHELSVLNLIREPVYSMGFSTEQLQAQVMFGIRQYNNGMRLIHIFSGLWLFPFGYLVFKSGFLPRVLGILLMLGCVGYLINFIGHTLIPGYAAWGIASYISLPASIGEIGTCLWLLLVGAREKQQ